MVLAHALTKDGEDLLLIGLSAENRRRLAAGDPIDFTTHVGEGHGLLHICLFAGETEDAMQAALFPLFDERTQVIRTGGL